MILRLFITYRHNFAPVTDKSVEEQKENALAKHIVRQINRIISNNLSEKVPHILSAQV